MRRLKIFFFLVPTDMLPASATIENLLWRQDDRS